MKKVNYILFLKKLICKPVDYNLKINHHILILRFWNAKRQLKLVVKFYKDIILHPLVTYKRYNIIFKKGDMHLRVYKLSRATLTYNIKRNKEWKDSLHHEDKI